MSKEAAAVLDNAIHSITHIPGARAVFTMINNDQFRYEAKAIKGVKKAETTLMVWNVAITYARQDTGEVLATRKQLAEDAGTNTD